MKRHLLGGPPHHKIRLLLTWLRVSLTMILKVFLGLKTILSVCKTKNRCSVIFLTTLLKLLKKNLECIFEKQLGCVFFKSL